MSGYTHRFRNALLSVLCVSLFFSCADEKLTRENLHLQEQLEISRTRINQLELYINELQVQVVDREVMLSEETARMEEAYQKLTDEMVQEIEKGQVEIANIKGVLTINIMETVFFDSGSVEIKDEGKKLLLRIGALLKTLPEKHVRVEGHTDNIPIGEKIRQNYPTNWELGAIRAVSVVRFLEEEANVEPSRLSAVSFSHHRPLRSNKSAAGRRKNRRIELVVINKQLYQMMEAQEKENGP